jgi:tetratricopeptide (TPR) repeat protein
MQQTLETARSICLLASFVLLGAAVLIRWLQRTEDDRGWLMVKWIISLLAIWIYRQGFAAGPFIIMYALIAGLILMVLWTGTICRLFARPFANLYYGNDGPPDPKPFYSVARALRSRGRQPEAVAEIQRQLERFPSDFEGQLLLAEIQAADLHNMSAAEATIEAICQAPRQTPQNIAAALNTLADWHLRFAKDHEATRCDLQRISELFPGTEAALGAAQRSAHLGAAEKPWSLVEHRKIVVPEGVKNYGLTKEPVAMTPAEIRPEDLAAKYVKQLEQHPLDTEAREKLALLYAQHYLRLDLATDQLEQLIGTPNLPVRTIAHWLNLLADLQIHCGNDPAAARQSLQRIVDRFPNTAVAELAQNRMELLGLEWRAKGKSQAVKLGSYEQNIGLKYGRPPQR